MGRLDFVRSHDDLVITGKSGTGKSHLLKALGLRACQQQISMRYARCVDLLDDLYAGLSDNTYTRRLQSWARPDLLIIDDVGLGQVKKRDDEPTAAHTLFNLIDRRHGRTSTAVSSNIALSDWRCIHGSRRCIWSGARGSCLRSSPTFCGRRLPLAPCLRGRPKR